MMGEFPYRLRSWDELNNHQWSTLVVGNGASINIWDKFEYSRLFDRAQLKSSAKRLFGHLGTANFEVVLESLWHAERVLGSLNREQRDVAELYDHVRAELVATIGRVHVSWTEVPGESLVQVAEELARHRLVFSLNYDLLTYWSFMYDGSSGTNVKDFLWGDQNTFDPTDAELSTGCTGILYPHGGVHLWQDASTGRTGKWTSQAGRNLLSQLADNLASGRSRQPLVVTEGTWSQKMGIIRRSDYLSFAHQCLVRDVSDTVIFGAGLGDQDLHIAASINSGRRRRIAISVYPKTPMEDTAMMGHYWEMLPGHELVFFDSRTHPLGDPCLHIDPPRQEDEIGHDGRS